MFEKKPVHHIVAGLIIAFAVLLASVVLWAANGANAGAGVGWVGILVMVAGLIYFIGQYGKALNYQATFGDYFNYGFKAATMVVLVYVVYLLALSLTVPDMKQAALDATRTQLKTQRNVTEKEIETVMEMTSKKFWVLLIGTSVFLFAFIGAIGSLIGAAVTKKLPKDSSEQSSI